MSSIQSQILKRFIRFQMHRLGERKYNFQLTRKLLSKGTYVLPLPKEITYQKSTIKNVSIGKFSFPTADAKKVLLYFHGGGYVFGSVDTHKTFTAELAKRIGIEAISVDYRLAPEHPFPSGLEDSLQVYDWLLNHGYSAKDIIIAGDSAGGGMTAALLLASKERNWPMPAGALLISPWLDLTMSGKSIQTRAKADPCFDQDVLTAYAKAYYQDQAADQPLISPVFGNLENLPPIYIQVGDNEMLLDDSTRFVHLAKLAGSKVELDIWPSMIHVFQFYKEIIPEAKQALDKLSQRAKTFLYTVN